MFGSQVHALPDTNIYRKKRKIESTVYTFSITSLRAPTASERLMKIGNQIQ